MKAITVKPPWSWAVTHGPKRIENRFWQCSYRGPLAIHAGKGWDTGGQDSPLVRNAWAVADHDLCALTRKSTQITVGAVVAVADLTGICGDSVDDFDRICCGPWAARGQYHWQFTRIQTLAEPVPCKGALGLWTLPDGVEAAVIAQLGEQVDTRG